MKQIKCRLMIIFSVILIGVFGKNASTTVSAEDLDEIENYTIYAEPDWEDGSVYLTYSISWKVLDSDTEGPLEWVKIGIPNSSVEEMEGLSSNIDKISYYQDGGNYVRIDFERKYYEGETVDFSFRIHQHRLYRAENGERIYSFTPGWFDDIYVDELNVYWAQENAEPLSYGYTEENGYYKFETSLEKGQKSTFQIKYDAGLFAKEDDKEIDHPVSIGVKITMAVFLLGIPGLALAVLILPRKNKKQTDYYKKHSGFGNMVLDHTSSGGNRHGHSGGGGCACACACACAGGGRAGCSKKDFYGTKLTVIKIRETMKKQETGDDFAVDRTIAK